MRRLPKSHGLAVPAEGPPRHGEAASGPRASHPVAANDDEQRWSEFQKRLRRYVASRVDSSWADDLTSDILLRLLKNKGRLERARNPFAWAYRVAANAITDHRRRGAAESRALERAEAEEALWGATADAEGPELRRREIEACLMPFILDLPAKYAEALLLTALQGLSQGEAARLLGLSVSGMKSRVQRARAELKRRLLSCCEFQRDSRGRVMEMRPRTVSETGGSGRSQSPCRGSTSPSPSVPPPTRSIGNSRATDFADTASSGDLSLYGRTKCCRFTG